MKQTMIIIPKGMLSADDAVAEELKKLRELLLSGNELIVTESGEIKLSSEVKPSDGDFVKVPKNIFYI